MSSPDGPACGGGAPSGKTRVVIVPGNGGGDVWECNWYAQVYAELATWPNVSPVLHNMPDPVRARETKWVPYMRDTLACGPGTVVIGHSSGAVAAMRLCEKVPVKGLVLVSACHTDLGVASERQAGYYSRPWQWEAIKGNAGWVIQYHSDDDPFIPVDEARHVAEHLGSEYHEPRGLSHFFTFDSVQPMLQELKKKLVAVAAGDIT
eukprot:m.213768 g.213768  ORF g.213768 m.213768 type:complete len:206 (+) comp26858_c0_seq1:105-722(+)